MKVVFATHRTNQYLGVNKYFYLLAKHLCKLGVDVRIVVDSVKGVKIAKELANVDVQMIGPTASNPLNTMRLCRNLNWYLAGVDPGIFHCGHVLPYFYLRNSGHKPVVFQPFGNELFTLSGRGLNPAYCKLAQPVLRFCGENADVLLAEGVWQGQEMERYYPTYNRMEVLPAAVETFGGICTKLYWTNSKRFQFLAVNSLLPYEGMDELIDAFRMVNSTCKLMIVGSGSEESNLKRMAKGLNIEFKKNLSENELKHLYFKADCFVSPTYETDMQMGVLEAMANGVPVISREARWLPYSVPQFKDVKELREKLQWVVSTSAAIRAEKGKKGLKWVEQYSFTEIAKKALEIYESLV